MHKKHAFCREFYKFLIALFLFLGINAKTVHASSIGYSIKNSLETILGQQGLSGLLQSPYIVFGVIVIVFFLIMMNTFRAILTRVKFFQGGGAEGINASGKMVSTGFALIGTIGVFYRMNPASSNFIAMLTAFGGYVVIIFMIIVYFMTYNALRTD